MTTTEDKPVDREAWRRLLDGEDEGPPELTDARIRAKARQAITPRTGRWWLPASLAASLLLAVVLVQLQYQQPAAPAVVPESDYALPPAEVAAPSPRDEALLNAAPSQGVEFPASAPARRQDGSLAETPTTAVTQRDASQFERSRDFVPPPPPVVPPPQIDVPAPEEPRVAGIAEREAPAADSASADAAPAAEAKSDKGVGEIVVTGSRRREGSLESTTPVTQVTTEDVAAGSLGAGLLKAGEAVRPPEEWYAEIEKLRAAGKKRTAKRELEKLKAAYPGWLEEHLKQEPPKQ